MKVQNLIDQMIQDKIELHIEKLELKVERLRKELSRMKKTVNEFDPETGLRKMHKRDESQK